MNSRVRRLLGSTAGLLPVRIRGGLAKGARWTAFPWTSYWRGIHEPSIQHVIGTLGDGNMRGWACWDLGAHFGLYSVALALKVGPDGEVAAFEPNPESFARLLRHKSMNNLTWLKAFEVAASNETGTSELLTYGDLGSTSTHLRYPDESHSEASKPIGIRTLRLDDEVESGRLRAPQFVKIDVEGHGHKALEGMKGTIAKTRPTLIIGLHSADEVSGVIGILNPLGYRWDPIVAPPHYPSTLVGGDYLFRPSKSA
jgi:FkbM family methyltransferase